MARSLRTLGYLNQRAGEHALGPRQLLQARELCETHQIADALVDVLDRLAGIYFQIGDFPTSLGYMHRQLALDGLSGRPGEVREVGCPHLLDKRNL